MRRTLPWLVPAIAVAALAIAWFWTHLPEWAFCIEEGPNRGCEEGTFVSNAIAGTVVLVIAVIGQLVAVITARGTHRTGILIASSVGFAILLLVALALQVVPLDEVPIPI